MFIVLYRWRTKEGMEDQLIENWSKVTEYYLEKFGALGSRLHKGNDGIWYAYAQWNSAEHRDKAFVERESLVARDKMREAIEEFLPEILLETVSDFLLFPDKTQ
jgi:hypothetical protein